MGYKSNGLGLVGSKRIHKDSSATSKNKKTSQSQKEAQIGSVTISKKQLKTTAKTSPLKGCLIENSQDNTTNASEQTLN